MSDVHSQYEYRFYKNVTNSAQCLACGQVIESKQRHDYVSCECGEISIDGGLDYCRYIVKNVDNFKNLSISRKFTEDELTSFIHDSIRKSLENRIYSSTYDENILAAAKYFRQLWYIHYEP